MFLSPEELLAAAQLSRDAAVAILIPLLPQEAANSGLSSQFTRYFNISSWLNTDSNVNAPHSTKDSPMFILC